MTKYESSVKQIYAPIEVVYEKLSDLTHLEAIRERVNDPNFEQIVLEKAGDQVKPEQVAKIKDILEKMEFTSDTISGDAAPLGKIVLRIIERDPNKCIKFALEGTPIQANLWLQLLPTELGCKLRATIGANLNFFIKQMLGNKIEQGVEGLATMLSMLPY